MTPSLPVQINPSVAAAVGGANASAPLPAGQDFLQALQHWLARIQHPVVLPDVQPQAAGPAVPPADRERIVLAALLARAPQANGDNGAGSGEGNTPLPLELTRDTLALLRHWLAEAGTIPAPAANETASGAEETPVTGGESLPAGESLPPADLLEALSAFTAQLEHWLARAGDHPDTLPDDGIPAGEGERLPLPPPSFLAAALAAGSAPEAERTVTGQGEDRAGPVVRHPLAARLFASLADKVEVEALRAKTADPDILPRAPSPHPAVSPLPQDGAFRPAPPPPVPLTAAPAPVPDDGLPPLSPQGADAPPALSEAGLPGAASAVGPNPPAVARDRPVLPPVATPVGHPGWDAEVGQRVVWMAGNSVSSAEIHLNPPHLGPVEVRISVNQDQQTSVQFLSPHAAVREALEAALPRLRDQFGAQQLNLGDVSVSQQSTGQHDHQQARGFQFQQQQQSSAWRGAEPEFPLGDGAGLAEEGERMRPVRVGQGLLNLYA